MRGHSVKRYKKIRSLYHGLGNDCSNSERPKLTPEELAAGRQKVIAYYTKRNRRIWTQIISVDLQVQQKETSTNRRTQIIKCCAVGF